MSWYRPNSPSKNTQEFGWVTAFFAVAFDFVSTLISGVSLSAACTGALASERIANVSLYGIIADLRRKYPTSAANETLDMVVAELGRTRDNLREAVANLAGKPLPPGASRFWTSSWSALGRRTCTTSTTDRTRMPGRHSSRLMKARPASAPCWRSAPYSASGWPRPRSTRGCTRSCIQVAEFSFDVVSEFDPAELTNALDQARREG